MPTVWINGVKHTPSARTLKKMRASEQRIETSPPTGVKTSKSVVRRSSKGVGAKGVPDKLARRAGGATPAQAAPLPRSRGDRPRDERKPSSASGSVAAGARQRSIADAKRIATSGSNVHRVPRQAATGNTIPSKPRPQAATGNTVPSKPRPQAATGNTRPSPISSQAATGNTHVNWNAKEEREKDKREDRSGRPYGFKKQVGRRTHRIGGGF